MKSYSLTHLSDETLTRGLAAAASRERATTAELIAYIAEFDARGLYRPAGYPSMHLYCEAELRLSPSAAYKRITAARVAREFPVVFAALADGRLNLTAVNLLAAHLTHGNAEASLSAAFGKAKHEIETMLAERFPRSETLALVEQTPARAATAPPVTVSSCQLAPERVEKRSSSAPTPLAPQRFSMYLSFGQEMQDDLRRAHELLGPGFRDPKDVLHRGLKALIRELEKSKCRATERPRSPRPRPSSDPRTVPAHVIRQVWQRDRGQCAFVSDDGKRCPERSGLELDHVLPVARGGESTTGNLRLLCRAHNQYAAERIFGAEHMRRKREEAARDRSEAKEQVEQVMRSMRRLGFTAEESRRAAAHAGAIPGASLEAQVRAALGYLVPPRRNAREFASARTS